MSKTRKLITAIALVLALAVVVAAAILTHENGAGNTAWALLAPIIAIALALITKEVYSSLFIGVVVGALLYSKSSFIGTVDTVINDGLITAVADSAGIFIFLVLLGIIVALVNKSGGSQAFGRWAKTHIKSKVGALIATFILGVLIFIDDYFNCLTVGSVMAPVTDSHKISRVKLAYIIDATAAPICMIAPISSWAAAVSGSVEGASYSGLELFVRAIPFNFYSLLTIVFVVGLAIMGFDYGKMSGFEIKAQNGDLYGNKDRQQAEESEAFNEKGRVIDLLLPIVLLIVLSVIGLIYVGGFFGVDAWGGTDYKGDFIGAFGNTDAYIGLPWGGLISLVVIVVYLIARRLVTFKEAMACIPKGFVAMVPAILILTLATALKNVTGLLGADVFVGEMMRGFPEALAKLLPAAIFLVASILAFASGTSWGTFGILIPIVTAMFDEANPLFFIGISACLAGAVLGDHCSPISDTTIMASAGAQCNHVDHVSTQLPYAISVGAISLVMFVFAGYVQNAIISLAVGTVLTLAFLFIMKAIAKKKKA